jgi:hypothetical protein
MADDISWSMGDASHANQDSLELDCVHESNSQHNITNESVILWALGSHPLKDQLLIPICTIKQSVLPSSSHLIC